MNTKKRPRKKRKGTSALPNHVDAMMEALFDDMHRMEFSKDRVRVALQRGGLRKMVETICDETMSDAERAFNIEAVDLGIHAMGLIPDDIIEEVVRGWDEVI